jgi:hypothetical protein
MLGVCDVLLVFWGFGAIWVDVWSWCGALHLNACFTWRSIHRWSEMVLRFYGGAIVTAMVEDALFDGVASVG